MSVTVKQDELKAAVNAVFRAIDPKASLAVMHEVRIETVDGKLQVSAANFDWSLSTMIAATITEPLSMLLPGRYFKDFLAKLPAGDTILNEGEPNTNTVLVERGSKKASVKGIPTTEAPPLKYSTGKYTITMKASVLRDMIRETEFAAAMEDNRPILTGILFELEGDALTLVCADGYRLALRSVTLDQMYTVDGKKLELVMNAEALREFIKFIDKKHTGDVTLTFPDHNGEIATLSWDHYVMSLKSLDGRFPDFRAIIDGERSYDTWVKAPIALSLEATQYVAQAAKDDAHSIKLSFTSGIGGVGDTASFVGRSAERGELSDDVAVLFERGIDVSAHYDSRFIEEALKIMSASHTECRFRLRSEVAKTHTEYIVENEETGEKTHVVPAEDLTGKADNPLVITPASMPLGMIALQVIMPMTR